MDNGELTSILFGLSFSLALRDEEQLSGRGLDWVRGTQPTFWSPQSPSHPVRACPTVQALGFCFIKLFLFTTVTITSSNCQQSARGNSFFLIRLGGPYLKTTATCCQEKRHLRIHLKSQRDRTELRVSKQSKYRNTHFESNTSKPINNAH